MVSESQLKEALLRPEMNVRHRALDYFARGNSSDTSVMPLVIEAIEKFGRQNAGRLIGEARELPQQEATIAWVVGELNDERSAQYENYAFSLSMVCVEADPVLLLSIRDEVLNSRKFDHCRQVYTERLEMLDWDAATCWRHLDEFGEATRNEEDASKVDLEHAGRIVEALSRHPAECESKVLDLLSLKIEDYQGHPLYWLEPLIVQLAGKARLTSAIPLIVGKLVQDCGDIVNDECAKALALIGNAEVLQAIDAAFPQMSVSCRSHACEALERIHSPLSIQTSLHLLREEQELRIQMSLAYALLCHFAPEGLETARGLLLGQKFDFRTIDLRDLLLDTCELTGERFPEYDAWQCERRSEKAEHDRCIAEANGDSTKLLLYALEKLRGKKAADISLKSPQPKPASRPSAAAVTMPRLSVPSRVGRNDPCPCGSGKKYKKCCLE